MVNRISAVLVFFKWQINGGCIEKYDVVSSRKCQHGNINLYAQDIPRLGHVNNTIT